MAIGLRLRVTNMADGKVLDRTFDRFPVRIGRNTLSDLQLNFPFVSQFHAVLDLQGTKLMLTDLGSRNGTHLRASGRIVPQTAIDLSTSNYEFAISNLLFQAFAVEVQASSIPLRMRGASFVLDEGQEAVRAAQSTADATQKLRPLYDAYRSAWTSFHQTLSRELAVLPPPQRAELVARLSREQPALASETDFQQLLSVYQLAVPKAEATASRDQSVITQAIKDLARSFVPFRPIENTSDIVCFLTKLQAVLDVFLKAFIPLRDGHKQFEREMDLPPAGVQQYQGTAIAVASATDPPALAAALLDWKDPTDEAPRAVRSTFAALMVHQVALLDGVMRGVKVLLDELSPAIIEQMAEKKGRLAWGPFRWESLWKAYAERHGELADEDKETFQLFFGKQFGIAYRQFTREGKLAQLPSQPAGPWEQSASTPSAPPPRPPGFGSGS